MNPMLQKNRIKKNKWGVDMYLTKKDNATQIVVSIFLLIFGVILLFPFFWLITSSLKSTPEILSRYLVWLPKELLWDNFSKGWKGIPPNNTFALFFKNTAIVTSLYTITTLLTSTLVAYGFARINFKFRNFWFLVLIATMMLPYQVTMIPQYLIWSKLHFVDTFVPLWSGGLWGGDAFFIFLIRQFIAGIPPELDEAAICDGCNKLGIYWRIILPLSKPVLFTVGLFAFGASYDNFFGSLLYINSIRKFTIQLGLAAFVSTDGYTEWGPVFAMTIITMIPMIIIFILTQKNLVKGINTTGLKG